MQALIERFRRWEASFPQHLQSRTGSAQATVGGLSASRANPGILVCHACGAAGIK